MTKTSQLRRPIFLIMAVVIAAAMLFTGCPETVNSPGTGTLEISLVLSGDAGGTPVLESASFSSTATSATFNVSHLLESIDIELDSEISGATVSINGQALTAGTKVSINLSTGLNVIAVAITPDSGSAVNYILNINRSEPPVLSDNADLAGLELSIGYLTPAFDATVVAYTSSVPSTTESITLTPTVTDSDASITVEGSAVSSGSASAAIELETGIAKPISVVVTAEDGDADKTYVVVVTRREVEDTDPPVITLIGDDPMEVIYGSTFTDPGADVVDSEDGSWGVYSSDTVDTSTAGDYDLTYNAEDLSGNVATAVTRTVTVLEPPELAGGVYVYTQHPDILDYIRIEITASTFMAYLQSGETFFNQTHTVEEYDNERDYLIQGYDDEGTFMYQKLVWSELSIDIYHIDAFEASSNIDTARTSISSLGDGETWYTDISLTVPVLQVQGDDPIELVDGDSFTDPGALVKDWGITTEVWAEVDLDGLAPASVTEGEYTLTYSYTDADDNTAVEETRTVTVSAKAPLELTDFYRRDIYSDAAYLHFEIIDSAYTVTVQGAGEVDNGTVEEYDNEINEAILYSLDQDSYYRVEWTDAEDGVFTETEFGQFDTLAEARTGSTGELSHTAYSTAAGVPPFLILIGDETLFLDVGDGFTDEGATVVDWGETNSITYASSLDGLNTASAAAGTYTLEYTSTDTDGNTAVPVTLTVIVGSGIADIIIQ